MSWLAPLAQAWLVAITAGVGLPLGALALSMIHKLTGGLWGEEARPLLRRVAGRLPLMLLLGLPLIVAIDLLLPFVMQAPDTLPPRVAAKLGYLQPVWIIARTIVVGGPLDCSATTPRSLASLERSRADCLYARVDNIHHRLDAGA